MVRSRKPVCPQTAQAVLCHIERAKLELDRDALHDLLKVGFEPSADAALPFEAGIALKPEISTALCQSQCEPSAALDWAGLIIKADRWIAYQLKMRDHFDGRIIVDEGDSWFQYPMLLTDVVDHLGAREDLAMRSLSAAGKTSGQVARRAEYCAALAKSGAETLMLSMGGNDLFGPDGFARALKPWRDGMEPMEAVAPEILAQTLARVMRDYRKVLCDVAALAPATRVLGHAYDLPSPAEGGKWLGQPLSDCGIPLDAGREITRHILDQLSDALKQLESEAPPFRFVDLRGVVDLGENSWFDEVHPKDAGFGRVAEVFRIEIERAPSRRSRAPATGPTDTPFVQRIQYESAPGHIVVLDPGHGGAPEPSKVGGSSWNNASGPNELLEKTLTLDIAKRTREILLSRGRSVVLTREADINPSLSTRASVAKVRQADAFVSLHFNASRQHDEQGTETFVHVDHIPASRSLCRSVQQTMVAALGYDDRNVACAGVKSARFGVINRAYHAPHTAAILHEVSFLDRPEEEAQLMSGPHKSKIARALADGIDAYLGMGPAGVNFGAEPVELGDAIDLGRTAPSRFSTGAISTDGQRGLLRR